MFQQSIRIIHFQSKLNGSYHIYHTNIQHRSLSTNAPSDLEPQKAFDFSKSRRQRESLSAPLGPGNPAGKSTGAVLP